MTRFRIEAEALTVESANSLREIIEEHPDFNLTAVDPELAAFEQE